jgi:hypothetical protein
MPPIRAHLRGKLPRAYALDACRRGAALLFEGRTIHLAIL